MRSSLNKPSQLKALLKKNWIIWKSFKFCVFLEFFIPIVGVLIMALLDINNDESFPNTSYLNDPNHLYHFDGTLNAKNQNILEACSIASGSARIGLAPEGDSLVKELQNIFETNVGLKTRLFHDVDDINAFTSGPEYGSSPGLTLCSAIVISKNNVDDKYEYTLLFNTTRSPDVRIRENLRMDLDSSTKYAKQGFLAIQNMIDNLILRSSTGNLNAVIQASLTPKIAQGWEIKRPPLCMEGKIWFLFNFPLLVPFGIFYSRMDDEIEILTGSSMNFKGLSKTTHYISWAIIYLMVFTIISIFSALVLSYSTFPLSGFLYIFLWHWGFSLWLIVFGIFLFILSEKYEFLVTCVMVLSVSLFPLQLFQVLDFCGEGRTELQLMLESLHPPLSLGLSGNYLQMLEMTQLGLTLETINLPIFNYKIMQHYIMTLVDIVIYIILCFCLGNTKQFFNYKRLFSICIREKRSSLRSEEDEPKENKKLLFELASPESFQDVEPRLSLQNLKEDSIKVQNISKRDSSGKMIVNDVSFTIHKNQIFALLGPKDKGKAAIISMIKGNERPTEGTIEIFGRLNQDNIHIIKRRDRMDYCFPRANYWELTVKENLEFYASIKGVCAEDLAQEVETIMKDFGLFNKKDELTVRLLTEETRILTLCINLIGSKFVILETLFSDMSLSEQRKLWDIIKKYKDDRVILLNTESTDEAYYLADMIGTTAEGTIIEIEEPSILQAKFRGYRLTVMKQGFDTPSHPIIAAIYDYVREAKVLLDMSDKVVFQLPDETLSEFQALFDNLDMRKAELNISNYEICSNSQGNRHFSAGKPIQSNSNSPIDSPINFIDQELEDFDLKEQRVQDGSQLFWSQFKAIALKNLNFYRRDPTSQLCQFFLPLALVIIGTFISKLEIQPLSPSLPLYDNLYNTKFQVNYNAMVPNGEGLTLDSNFISKFDSNFFQLTPKMIKDIAELDRALSVTKLDILASNISVFSFYMDTFNKTTGAYKYTIFINTRAPEGGPFAFNKINNAILKSATGNNRKEITVTISPFQKPLDEKKHHFVYGHVGFQIALILGTTLFFTAVFCFVQNEEEHLIRSQQTLAGVSAATYWLANYFADIIKYLIWAILSCLIMIGFGVPLVTEGSKLGALWAIFISFGFSATSFTYLFCCWFKHKRGVIILIFIILILFASVLSLFPHIMIESGIEPFGSMLKWIFKITPFTINFSLFVLFDLEMISGVKKSQVDVFDIDLILGDVIVWISGAFIYFGLLLLMEYRKFKKTRVTSDKRESSQRYGISVDNLLKIYTKSELSDKYDRVPDESESGDSVVAVNQVSFDIKEGECFAIVGPKNAGKTTICNILTGDTIPTDGKVFINGFSIPGQMSKVKRDIGYHSQTNSLFLYLTVKEHLNFYAEIKGISHKVRERLIAKHLHEMQLSNFRHVLIENLSAENKLKVSLAIALMGNPSILILDGLYEGAGLKEKLTIYNAISQAFRREKQPTIIFTTQSIFEAETLATKIGVMTKGSFRSIGPIQQIKDEFYQTELDITVEMDEISQEQIESAIQRSGSFSNEKIDRQRVDQILDQLELGDLKKEIDSSESGVSICRNLIITNSISINFVIEWALTIQNGRKVKEFLRSNFGETTMWGPVPNSSSFIFQLKNHPSVGKVFELLQSNKAFLGIKEYSIHQIPREKLLYRSMSPAPQNFWDFAKSETIFKKTYDPSKLEKPPLSIYSFETWKEYLM